MIFRKTKGLHISEYKGHKELSLGAETSTFLKPDFIYIPLTEQGAPCECLVKVGDQVKLGQVVAMKTGRFGLPLHSSISGVVTAIDKKMWHATGMMVPMIEIKNDFLETFDPSIKANPVQDLTRQQMVDVVKQCGVVGLGGSSFPTYVKYQSNSPIHTIIINAVECEPFITVDYVLSKTKTEKLISGIKYIMRATDASIAFIVVKENKKALIELLNQRLSSENDIQLFLVKDVYPAGWEKFFVQKITKKTYKTLPSEVGVVVNNAATAIAVCEAVEDNMPLIQKLVTFTGEGLQNPQNVLVKIGVKVNDVIAQLGGYSEKANDARFIAGGPMTGKAIAFDSLVVHRALGSIIVLPKVKEAPLLPCLGCGKCCEVCPVFLSPIEIKRTLDAKDNARLKELKADKCMQCGLCSYVCPSRIELTEATTKARGIALKG